MKRQIIFFLCFSDRKTKNIAFIICFIFVWKSIAKQRLLKGKISQKWATAWKAFRVWPLLSLIPSPNPLSQLSTPSVENFWQSHNPTSNQSPAPQESLPSVAPNPVRERDKYVVIISSGCECKDGAGSRAW